jgi:hypothetical protein
MAYFHLVFDEDNTAWLSPYYHLLGLDISQTGFFEKRMV